MDFRTLKPREGWRNFAGEVGVIVLGVLLALGAQQLATDWQDREDERAFRNIIDNEIAMNLFVLDYHSKAIPCARRQVSELRTWVENARAGAAAPAIYIRSPFTFDPYLSAWSNRDADTFRKLTTDVRTEYAMFYDLMASETHIDQGIRDAVQALVAYREPGPLDLSERRRIYPKVSYISGAMSSYEGNSAAARDIASKLGIRMVTPPDLYSFLPKLDRRCHSLFEPPKPAVPTKS